MRRKTHKKSTELTRNGDVKGHPMLKASIGTIKHEVLACSRVHYREPYSRVSWWKCLRISVLWGPINCNWSWNCKMTNSGVCSTGFSAVNILVNVIHQGRGTMPFRWRQIMPLMIQSALLSYCINGLWAAHSWTVLCRTSILRKLIVKIKRYILNLKININNNKAILNAKTIKKPLLTYLEAA